MIFELFSQNWRHYPTRQWARMQKLAKSANYQIVLPNTIVLHHVRHVPELKRSLVSISMLVEDGYRTTLIEFSWMISRANMKVRNGCKHNNLYPLMAINLEGTLNVVESTDSNLWHGRLGHNQFVIVKSNTAPNVAGIMVRQTVELRQAPYIRMRSLCIHPQGRQEKVGTPCNQNWLAKRFPLKLIEMSLKDRSTRLNQKFDKQSKKTKPTIPLPNPNWQEVEIDSTKRLTRGERDKVETTKSPKQAKVPKGHIEPTKTLANSSIELEEGTWKIRHYRNPIAGVNHRKGLLKMVQEIPINQQRWSKNPNRTLQQPRDPDKSEGQHSSINWALTMSTTPTQANQAPTRKL